MLEHFDAVIFDWDGTLFNSLPFVFQAHNHVRGQFGLPLWSEEEFRHHTVYSSKELYPQIYGDKTQDALDILTAYYDMQFHSYIVPFDGAFDLLARIRAAGKPMAVVSNMRMIPLQAQAAWFKVDHFFKVIAGSGYADRDKPDAAPIIKAIGEMGLKPGARILYVGDTVTDLRAGSAAQCTIAFINHGDDPSNPLLAQYKPQIVVSNISGLQETLFASGNKHKVEIKACP